MNEFGEIEYQHGNCRLRFSSVLSISGKSLVFRSIAVYV